MYECDVRLATELRKAKRLGYDIPCGDEERAKIDVDRSCGSFFRNRMGVSPTVLFIKNGTNHTKKVHDTKKGYKENQQNYT